MALWRRLSTSNPCKVIEKALVDSVPPLPFDLQPCCCFCDDLCPYWNGKSNNPRLCQKACDSCWDHQANLHPA